MNFSALAENDLFRSAFDHASIGMALVGTDGTWLEVNDSVCRITGYSREELLQKNFQDITHPDDLEKDLAFVNRMLADKINHYEMEKRYFHKNGQIVWGLLTVSLVRNNDGNPRFFISQIQDISERKEMELQLRRRENTLKSVLNNTQAVIIRINREARIVYVNSAAQSVSGVHANELFGKRLSELSSVSDNAQVYEKAVSEVFETKREGHLETERKVNGQTAHFITHFTPEFDENGEFETVLSVSFNVTKLKNTENELRNAVSEIKRLQEMIPICSYCKDIRDDQDYWHTVESYLSSKTDAKFTHSICPDCYETEVVPQIKKLKKAHKNKG